MGNLDKIIEAINIPKRLVDSAELFLRKLFGAATVEIGQSIADEIRFRRFRNQVNIFTKAKYLLETKSIEPKQINLKLLVPLIEYSSLEEDEEVQNIWANIIANIASSNTEQLFNLKCIETLKEITPNEIFCLDHLFNGFKGKEKATLEAEKNNKYLNQNDTIHPSDFLFSAFDLVQELKLEKRNVDLYVDRLISFGIIKLQEVFLHESSTRMNVIDKYGKTSLINLKSYELDASDSIHFTHFGLYFVKLCKFNI